MCPIPFTAVYKGIAENTQAPQGARNAALAQIELQTSVHETLGKAASTVVLPSTGNSDFTCTIYSLQNKDYWGHGDDSKVLNPREMIYLPGILIQDTKSNVLKHTDGTNNTDEARKKTYDGFRATYDFYKSAFNRHSIDDQGLEIRASIHLSRGFDNASWDSEKKQMFFGDGGRFDGRFWLYPSDTEMNQLWNKEEHRFDNLSNYLDNYDLDTIGHELTHGVVHYTADLGHKQARKDDWPAYSEAATLNEHIADCFGIMLKHFVNKQTADQGNWDFSPNVWSDVAMKAQGWTGNYCRTFKIYDDREHTPDPYPKHWSKHLDFVGGKDDKYGLDRHLNCGIPSHAFYLAALDFGGYAWETVGRIWYDALKDSDFTLPEKQTFRGWKELTLSHANKLFGANGMTKLGRAWQAVGL